MAGPETEPTFAPIGCLSALGPLAISRARCEVGGKVFAQRIAGRKLPVRWVLKSTIIFALCVRSLTAIFSGAAHAQAGPPFLTNDAGTPGNAHWEINFASMQTISRDGSSYQIPQIDLNFGLGDRIQLTYEVPYVLQSSALQRVQGGWSNGSAGIKWRFLDEGETGWQMSTFPQVETGVSAHARQLGIGVAGPRYLFPMEVSRKIGPVAVDFEAAYYLAGHGPRERILGFVAGRPVTNQLELDAEIYDDRVYENGAHSTTLDLGGRYKLAQGLVLLYMAGRSVHSLSSGQPEFIGYIGIQILLSNYGRELASD
jgi:hypothetical protein